ncbi:hypothetical protein BGAL_0299g00110 [Botrytis galanthina]|uniref:Uncharacterized protein n=1 Tax=Botrytis galanthina TaxID=278940 RepID=A0A4S8QTG5_9HELO|nr:hypothetical protein BGAL_0299g00110 [Botrytis galanthina]
MATLRPVPNPHRLLPSGTGNDCEARGASDRDDLSSKLPMEFCYHRDAASTLISSNNPGIPAPCTSMDMFSARFEKV